MESLPCVAVWDLDYQRLIVAALCLRYEIAAQLTQRARDENDADLFIGEAAVDRILDRLSVVHKLAVDTRKAHSDKRIGIVAYQIKTHNFRSFQRSVKLYHFTLPFFCPEGVRPC